MNHLRPCTECNRHVRASSTVCPFCKCELSVELQAPVRPSSRLSRAAFTAFRTTVAIVASSGCTRQQEIASVAAHGGEQVANLESTDKSTAEAFEASDEPVGPGQPVRRRDAGVRRSRDASPDVPIVIEVDVPRVEPIVLPYDPGPPRPYGAPPADGWLEIV